MLEKHLIVDWGSIDLNIKQKCRSVVNLRVNYAKQRTLPCGGKEAMARLYVIHVHWNKVAQEVKKTQVTAMVAFPNGRKIMATLIWQALFLEKVPESNRPNTNISQQPRLWPPRGKAEEWCLRKVSVFFFFIHSHKRTKSQESKEKLG